jgi:predicted amidohydrolase
MMVTGFFERCAGNIRHRRSIGPSNQKPVDPTEDTTWVPGTKRSIFEVNGVKFGITICHEGFRYPESVRWAAREGASIVFHPHLSGSDLKGVQLTDWGDINSPYYEKAMMMRALENTIYFASVGYTMKYQEAATSLNSPRWQMPCLPGLRRRRCYCCGD